MTVDTLSVALSDSHFAPVTAATDGFQEDPGISAEPMAIGASHLVVESPLESEELQPVPPSDEVGPERSESDEAGSDRPEEMAAFLEQHFPEGLIYANEEFHVYVEGHWRRLDEKHELRRRVCEFYGSQAKPGGINTLLALLRDFQARAGHEIAPNPSLICLENGTFDTDSYGLIPHSPEHWLRNRVKTRWEQTAQSDRWLQFLDELFTGDNDKPDKIAFLQQWFGYCLVPDTSQQKFLWLVGSGGNGKSVVLTLLEALVGDENVTHAHLEQLGNKFVRVELENKLLNVSPEIGAKAKISDSYLKQIVGGDKVQAERKFKDSFSFRPYARLVAATNHLPKLKDLTEGFARRAIILTFNRTFSQGVQNPRLVEELRGELPGIFAWAVAGLQELRRQGHFTIPASSVTALEQYRTESDPEKMFANARLEFSERGTASPDLYAHYVNWTKAYGLPAKDRISFGKRLREFKFEHRKSNGKKFWKVAVKKRDDADAAV